jgi:hypothetical protein
MTRPARRTAVLLLLAVFIAGAAAGWVLEELVDDIDWPVRSGDHGQANPPARGDTFDEDEEEDFLRTLGLTTAQRDSMDHLLDAGEDRLEAYWAGKLPEMEALLDSTRSAIKASLTPEQRTAYDRWLAGQRHPNFER